MERQKMRGVFKRLSFLFIVIILIIYVCVIGIFLAYAAYRRQEERNAMQAMARQGKLALEEQLDSVANLEKNLVSDSRASDLSQGNYGNDYEKSRLAMGLIGSMWSFQSANTIIQEIEMFFPELEMTLSTRSGTARDIVRPCPRAEGDTARRLVYSGGKVWMELWYPLTHSIEEGYMPDYGVKVTLSEDYLEELLSLFAIDGRSGGFSAFDTGEELLRLPPEEGGLMEVWRSVWEILCVCVRGDSRVRDHSGSLSARRMAGRTHDGCPAGDGRCADSGRRHVFPDAVPDQQYRKQAPAGGSTGA